MAIKVMTVKEAVEADAIHPLTALCQGAGLYLGIPQADLPAAEAEAARRGIALGQLMAERYIAQLSAEIDERCARG